MVDFNRKKSEAEQHEKYVKWDIIGNNRKHVSKRPDDEEFVLMEKDVA